MLGYWDTRGLMDRNQANTQRELQIRQQAADALAGLQGAQAREIDVKAGLLPGTVRSETDFRDANTATVRAGLPFVAPRAQADINQIDANTGLTKQKIVTERFQPSFIMSNVGVNNANARATNNLSASTGVGLDGFMRRYTSMFGGMP